ncbi:gamma-glutamylcyclotransferase family protein [Embleya sp. MST-111070]|uniref:gamma-glutamylcyclotransferase family protein n=1 Tax=Embleya sp. MST-111070 TaxID=3398231 RepID=UPI003F733E4B
MTPASAQLPVFVYGTLRPKQDNYGNSLRGSTIRARSAVLDDHLLLEAGLPYTIPDPDGRHHVVGDVLDVDPEAWPEVLAWLDALEDYAGEKDDHYTRVIVTVRTIDEGENVQAYAYLAGPGALQWRPTMTEVPGGDWVMHRAA